MTSADKIKSHSDEWLFSIWRFGPLRWTTPLAVCVLVLLSGCADEATVAKLSGPTMGTHWHLTALIPAQIDHNEHTLEVEIQKVLEAVNASMSTYRTDSEISRFNQAQAQQWFEVSDDFYQVLSAALAIGWRSGGAYDITVGPLVNIWGFGPTNVSPEPPSAEAIDEVMLKVGQDKLQVDGDTLKVRKLAPLYLDFSSIAKGFAVDEIARWLTSQGIQHYLVEVGGELRVSGHSMRGDAWRVAIEQPEAKTMSMAQTIRLEDVAVATSGDYRNFYQRDGIRYSHSIDPRTGQPVKHELVSVTVVHPSAMVADAWATALTVLGPVDAMNVATAESLAVYFIQRSGEGFQSSFTAPFGQYLEVIDRQVQDLGQ